MKLCKRISLIVVLVLLALSFNSFAMPQNLNANEPAMPVPSEDGDYQYGYRWTWLSDELCVQFQMGGPITAKIPRSILEEKCDYGLMRSWHEDGKAKARDTYAGKWSQTDDGIWAFVFDDSTIPIDLTRIDGVLYAFNGYGELVDGYKYWNDYKTGPDGLVTCTEPEFLAYLETQYIPDCTSHE